MARVYKKEIDIFGYGKYDLIVNVSKKGNFSTTMPRQKVADGVVEMDWMCASTLKGLEEKVYKSRRQYEMLYREFELVLLFKMVGRSDFRDGSGVGMMFNWGVFKKIGFGNRIEYHFLRGHEDNGEVLNSWHRLKDEWNEIKHTKKVERYFYNMTNSLLLLRENLTEFLSQDLNEIDLPPLLGSALKNDNIKNITHKK